MSWGQRFEVINYQAFDIGERCRGGSQYTVRRLCGRCSGRDGNSPGPPLSGHFQGSLLSEGVSAVLAPTYTHIRSSHVPGRVGWFKHPLLYLY